MIKVEELKEKIAKAESELEEIAKVREHCADNGWWSIVTACKGLISIKNRELTLFKNMLSA